MQLGRTVAFNVKCYLSHEQEAFDEKKNQSKDKKHTHKISTTTKIKLSEYKCLANNKRDITNITIVH